MRISNVIPESPAHAAGLRRGDEILTLGGQALRDAIDFTFALAEFDRGEEIQAQVMTGGHRATVVLPAVGAAELGVEFAEGDYRVCGNRCIFCFVDQLPRGLRKTLYVKDEDYRLSFLTGNYITLTNLSEDDLARIEEQRLTPLYISVHATDDAVRRRMLGNPEAPPIMRSLRELKARGVAVHTQVVVCPGVNDGAVLERTLSDLVSLGPTVSSIAVVPVGLTKHREGLPEVAPVTQDDAGRILSIVHEWQARLEPDRGSRVVYAADELYLLSASALPPRQRYDDLPQLENGVGMLRAFEAELRENLRKLKEAHLEPLSLVLVTGRLSADFMRTVVVPALETVEGLSASVLEVSNEFLGPSVTVSGLLTGEDMTRALLDSEPAGSDREELVLLPGEAFNDDGLTLDGMTLADIASRAGFSNAVVAGSIVDGVLDFIATVDPSRPSPKGGERT